MRIKFCILLLFLSLYPTFCQNRLAPVGRSSSFEYYQLVDKLLSGDGWNKFAYQVRPSFDPESCLSFSDKTNELVLREADKSIYLAACNSTLKDLSIDEYRCPISTEVSAKLDSLFMSAVFSSSLMAGSRGHDGTTYELQTFWGYYAASCWSPKPDGSNCSRLVRVLEAVCEFVKEDNAKGIEELIPEIEALTEVFTNLLPKGERIMDPITGYFYESP